MSFIVMPTVEFAWYVTQQVVEVQGIYAKLQELSPFLNLATPKKLSCNFDKKSLADEPTTFCVSPNQRSIGTKAHAMALPSARVQKCLLREATQVDRRMGPWNPKEPFR